jgi:hypothetical protein
MIYEVRTYDLKPRSVEEFEKRFGEAYKFMHIWPYPSLDARAATRSKAQAAGAWPPSPQKYGTPPYQLLHQENKILIPASFSPLQ